LRALEDLDIWEKNDDKVVIKLVKEKTSSYKSTI